MEKLFEKNKKRTGSVIFSKYIRGEAIKKVLELGRENILFEMKDSGLKGSTGTVFSVKPGGE